MIYEIIKTIVDSKVMFLTTVIVSCSTAFWSLVHTDDISKLVKEYKLYESTRDRLRYITIFLLYNLVLVFAILLFDFALSWDNVWRWVCFVVAIYLFFTYIYFSRLGYQFITGFKK